MRIPIQYCLSYPKRLPQAAPSMDFAKMMELTFLPPDPTRFRALKLARQVLNAGGSYGTIFNAANEAAVARFLNKTMRFDQIPMAAEMALEKFPSTTPRSLDNILAVNSMVYDFVMNQC